MIKEAFTLNEREQILVNVYVIHKEKILLFPLKLINLSFYISQKGAFPP